MRRVLLSALFGVGLLAFTITMGTLEPHAFAQDKKKEDPKPKAKKIVVSDPKELKDDKDFAIQGEYEGSISLNSGDKKIGVQVVAKSEGNFVLKILIGGLPGGGWGGKTEMAATAKLGEDGTAAITGKDISGSISKGELTLKDGMKIDTKLKKVERKSSTMGAKPPEGAIVLFGKEGDEKNWNNGKIVELSDGKFLNMGITSKQKFTSFKAHFEFRLPWMPNSSGQGRGNSGVYLQDRYEIQVLDSFGLKGENNECGGIYTLHKPIVNMCFPPMLWQTYDVEYTAPVFEGDKKVKNARATVLHNGVKIHDNVELKNGTGSAGLKEGPEPGPFQLQNHGDPLVYRNIWVVETK